MGLKFLKSLAPKKELENKAHTMRILLIDVTCKIGSTGKIVYNMYNYINSQGDEAAICFGRGPKVRGKNIYKFGLDWETYLHAFLTRVTGWTGCFSYFSTKRLIKFIKKFKPDVVHIHELHAYFVNVVYLLNYLKKQNIKVVHTLHCTFSYTGKCGHHLDCEKWKDSCGKCPKLKEYVSTLCFDHTKSMFLKKKKAFNGFKNMTIVCPSQWLATYTKQSFLGQYPIEVIHNGIDTSIFHPKDSTKLRKKLGIDWKTKIVLAVAPKLMSEAKGGKWILKLAELMKEENVVFIMIGVDEINKSYPRNVLVFPRTSNQQELADFYSMADVFVICSKMENFPTTCLEAQCCGTSVCGFDVGGVKETLLANKQLLVEYGDVHSLAKAIDVYLNNYSKTKEIVLSDYSNHRMMEKYLRIYRR